MPFDIVGFSEAAPGANALVAAGGGDTLYKVTGDDLMVKKSAPFVLGLLYAAEATGERARLQQPSLAIDYEFIKCMLTADLDPMLGYHHLFGRPLPLVVEKLNAYSVNAGDEDTIIGAILGSGKITQDMLDAVNPTHKITGYGDTTITANTWSACAITWNQSLPKGDYAIVGMRASVFLAANPWVALARLTGLKGEGAGWRPGVPCAIAEADHEEYQSIGIEPWHMWPLMREIQFPHDDLPNIEVLSPAAHTDENVELLLQKIA